VIYLLFQLGMLAGFLAARQLDEAVINLKLHRFGHRLSPGVGALVAAVGPGVTHLITGRIAAGAYTVGSLLTVLGLVPVPLQLSSIPFGLTLIPVWLLSVVDAWRLCSQITS